VGTEETPFDNKIQHKPLKILHKKPNDSSSSSSRSIWQMPGPVGAVWLVRVKELLLPYTAHLMPGT